MAVRFHAHVAVVSGEFDLARIGMSGTVVFAGTDDPAPISEDAAGAIPIPNSRIEVSELGLVREFWLQPSGDEKVYEVEWLAEDGTRVPMHSPQGLMEAARAPGAAMFTVAHHPTEGWPPRPSDRGDVVVLWLGSGPDERPPGALPGDLHMPVVPGVEPVTSYTPQSAPAPAGGATQARAMSLSDEGEEPEVEHEWGAVGPGRTVFMVEED